MTNSGVMGVACWKLLNRLPFLAAAGMIWLGLPSSTMAVEDDEYYVITHVQDDESAPSLVVSFYKFSMGPPPGYVPILGMQRETLPNTFSTEMAPGHWNHQYAKIYGPDEDANPPFAGFEQGKMYKLVIERWNETTLQWDFKEERSWVQGQ